jgi:hypothetical protein
MQKVATVDTEKRTAMLSGNIIGFSLGYYVYYWRVVCSQKTGTTKDTIQDCQRAEWSAQMQFFSCDRKRARMANYE